MARAGTSANTTHISSGTNGEAGGEGGDETGNEGEGHPESMRYDITGNKIDSRTNNHSIAPLIDGASSANMTQNEDEMGGEGDDSEGNPGSDWYDIEDTDCDDRTSKHRIAPFADEASSAAKTYHEGETDSGGEYNSDSDWYDIEDTDYDNRGSYYNIVLLANEAYSTHRTHYEDETDAKGEGDLDSEEGHLDLHDGATRPQTTAT
jgi:hypothetical protein